MSTLRFYGTSNNLFLVDGASAESGCDEIGCCGGGHPATVCVIADGFGLYVTAQYAIAGVACWMIGISQLNEDVPLPPWPMQWFAEGYSTVLEIEVPDGFVIKEMK